MPRGASGGFSDVVLGGGGVIGVSPTAAIAFDAATGGVDWMSPRARGALLAPALDPANGMVAFAEGTSGHGSAVVGVDAMTGAPRWRATLREPARSAVTAAGGLFYFGTGARTLDALDARSGTMRLRAAVPGIVSGAPAVVGSAAIAVAETATTGGVNVVAVDTATGRSRWRFSPRGVAAGVTSPSVANGLVYVGFGDGFVRALRGRDGAIAWTAPVRAAFSPQSSPAVGDGLVVFEDRVGGVFAFDARSGARRWDFQFSATSVWGAPLIAGRTVYVGLDDGTVAALSTNSGRLRWRTRLRSGPVGALTPSGATVLAPLVGGGGGAVVTLTHRSGSLLDVASPTSLDLPRALSNYAVGFVATFAAIVLLFRVLGRPRRCRAAPGATSSRRRLARGTA